MAESPFIKDTNIQWAWDSTSLGLIKECPRKYYYTQIQGYRQKGESIHLDFGGIFAKCLQDYNILRLKYNRPHDHAVFWSVRTALVDSAKMSHDNDKKNRETLVRSLIWYLDTYENDECKTVVLDNGSPAVELSFKLETGVVHHDTEFLYCGHLDRLVDFNGDLFVMDQKTTGSSLGPYYFTQYNPDNQMSGYSLASKIIFNTPVQGVIIDAIQVAVGFTNFSRSITTRTEQQLEEWLDDFQSWTTLAVRFAETNKYPMNDKSCHKYGGCPFRQVCSHDERVRQNFLDTQFEVRRWNPLEER